MVDFFTHIAQARVIIQTKIIGLITCNVRRPVNLTKLLSSHLHLIRLGRILILFAYSNAEIGRIDLYTQHV